MSSDGRTLPPPGRRKGPTLEPLRPFPKAPPAPPQRHQPPPLPAAERTRQDTQPGIGSLDAPEAVRALQEAEAREAELLAQLKAISKQPVNVSWPPPTVEDRRRAPSSVPAKEPRGPWERLGYKVATAAVAGLVLVIGAVALWAYTAVSARTQAIQAAQEAKEKAETHDEQVKRYLAVIIWMIDCRNDQQLEVNEQLLPAPDHMGSARKPEAWVVKCPKKLPPPP